MSGLELMRLFCQTLRKPAQHLRLMEPGKYFMGAAHSQDGLSQLMMKLPFAMHGLILVNGVTLKNTILQRVQNLLSKVRYSIVLMSSAKDFQQIERHARAWVQSIFIKMKTYWLVIRALQ